MNGHADRKLGDLIQIIKPTFANLLHTTSLIELYDAIGVRGIEIGRGIIECKMPIFSDTTKARSIGATKMASVALRHTSFGSSIPFRNERTLKELDPQIAFSNTRRKMPDC